MTKYKILLSNNQAEKGWYLLESRFPDAMESCKKFIRENPEDRLKAAGKLKKLKGRFTGILQYDISDKARIWYRVDKREHIAYIEYAGFHP